MSTRGFPTRLLLATSGLLAAALALSVLAARYDTFPGDRTIEGWVSGLGSAFEPIATRFNAYDHWGFAVLVIAAVVLLLRRRAFEDLALVALVVAMRPLIGLVKAVVDRPRPQGDFPIRDTFMDASFPSGHVATASTAFGIWFVLAPRLVPPWAVLPVRIASVIGVVLMAMSRMWAGVHWFSDTVGSVLWVATFFAVALVLVRLAASALRRSREPSTELRA